ncbi:MAG: FAD-dependent oxidoreductase, partial [Planctomycetes bacterium]|nr:FAD-dependent oxidoreductase [Planctomycetota bacterium]
CATPWGLTAFAAQKCVDATGNNDLVAAAGGETTPLVADEPAVQGAGLSPVLLGRDCVNSDYMFICDSDVVDGTRAYVMAHAKFLDRFDSSPILETRERRRVVGDLTLQPQDFFANRTYDDTVNVAYSNFDTHGFIVHPMFMLKPTDHTPHYAKVPYRAMLPRNLEGVLVTGLGMSAHRDCMPLIRMQPDVHNQGFAAGTAAAMAVKAGCGYRQIDMKALQRTLVEHEILPPAVLEEHDAIGEIAPDDTHYELARIFLEPAKARAELHARFAQAPTVADAHVLAFLGDACGRETLAQAVRDAAWDKGWNYTGMGQFGMSLSPLDSMIFALAKIGGDADAVLAKLHALRYEQEFSHVRAVSMALIAHPDKRAAAPLAALLGAYGATGHATRTLRDVFAANREAWNDTETRNLQLKELYLAKALAACDPESSLARMTLDAYRDSLNAYYAIFAAM